MWISSPFLPEAGIAGQTWAEGAAHLLWLLWQRFAPGSNPEDPAPGRGIQGRFARELASPTPWCSIGIELAMAVVVNSAPHKQESHILANRSWRLFNL
jgi:hypothetical protein